MVYYFFNDLLKKLIRYIYGPQGDVMNKEKTTNLTHLDLTVGKTLISQKLDY